MPIHVFPFRMTEENLEHYKDSEWRSFWLNIKDGYDAFEQTRRPPKVSVCNDKYLFQEQGLAEAGGAGPVAVCGQTAAMIEELERFEQLMPPHILQRLLAGARSGLGISASLAAPSLLALAGRAGDSPIMAINFHTRAHSAGSRELSDSCSPGLASCRRFTALQERVASGRSVVASQGSKKRQKTAARQ